MALKIRKLHVKRNSSSIRESVNNLERLFVNESASGIDASPLVYSLTGGVGHRDQSGIENIISNTIESSQIINQGDVFTDNRSTRHGFILPTDFTA